MEESTSRQFRLPAIILVVAMGCVVVTMPAARDDPRSLALAMALLVTGAAFLACCWHWLSAHPGRMGAVGLIAVLLLGGSLAITGGATSPITPLFALIVVGAAGFAPPRTATLLTAAAVAGRSSFLLYDQSVTNWEIEHLALDTAVLLITAMLTGALADRLTQSRAREALLPRIASRAASEAERQRAALALQNASLQTMVRLAEAVEAREAGTAAHCRRVAELSVAIAGELGIGAAETREIERGALLHDIGKIGVPDAVLLKPSKLDPAEWDLMRRHARLGYELLESLPYLEHARELVYAHHERWDGNGYPRGLKGTAIPLGARIFAVADAFDAMNSDRPYRKALPRAVILDELRRGSGTQFDPQVVTAMLRVLARTTPTLTAIESDRPRASA